MNRRDLLATSAAALAATALPAAALAKSFAAVGGVGALSFTLAFAALRGRVRRR